ncbi:hypothetical protein FACS1894205_0250 [Alphaproteobacteria bacterium]|nr:hypothetical protein FACS1894205_0250 [Alphaproteobacteria bacterium]
MFNRLSLKNKIFAAVTTVVIISFLLVISFVSDRSMEAAKNDAFNLAAEMADKYRYEIKSELQGARITAETLATVFETLKKHEITDRGVMNDILKNALAQKDYITAFCVAYDPDALDGKDKIYAGQKPIYDETGRFSPYWNKLEGSIAVEPLYDIDIADWYIVPKKTKHEYITDPYPYEVQGQSVMLTSLIFPIMHDDRFIGIISSDIVLDKLQEMVTRVNTYGQFEQVKILSNSGAVVAHTNKDHLGKDLTESLSYQVLVTSPPLIGDALRRAKKYMEENAVKDASDEKQMEHYAEIEKLVAHLERYAANPGGTKLDLALFTPQAAEKMLEADKGASRHAAQAKDAIKNGEKYVVSNEFFYTVYMPITFSSVTRPWSVAVSIPMEQVLKSANNTRNYVLLVSLISLCAIIFLLYFIVNAATKPILALTNAATSISEGNFDIEAPLNQSKDEIGVLSRTFMVMVVKIQELIKEMQGYTRELEEKNAHLSRLDTLKDEFLANTSHELRTPINGIIGIADSMVDGATGPLSKEQKYNLELVVNSGKRLSNMINDILDFTKLKNKEIILQLKTVDLKIVVDTVLTMSKHLFAGKKLELIDDIGDSLPMVLADENRLQQILYNLIGNAIKFTDRGKITVSAERVDGLIAVSVSDTGIGIPEDKFSTIFESFEQVDGSTAREYGGTGLGLSITKKLVELHGGAIDLASTLDEGSTFTFTMPIAQAQERDGGAQATVKPIIDMEVYSEKDEEYDYELADIEGAHRILIVDDEPVNIQVMKNLLMMKKFSITVAYSGHEALQLIAEEKDFDLVLLDVMMPKMSGYDVCKKLREEYSLFDLPVLMLTAKNQIQDIVLGLQSGANDYLQKPFDREELLARINTLLSLKDAVKAAVDHEKQFVDEREKRILERSLLEVTKAITSTLDLNELLVKILDAMSQFITFSKALVLLNEDDRYTVRASRGTAFDKVAEGAVIDVAHDTFLNEVIQQGQSVISGSLSSCLLDETSDDSVLAGIPIMYRDLPLGVIVLLCKKPDISSELLYTLAGQAGVAIQNARLFAKISKMATTDGLTGLLNRRRFFELAETEFIKYERYGHPLSVCMIDIDHFKKINDGYGHTVGDEVLRHLAEKLSGMVREYDIVGRYGGEEFAIVLPETPVAIAAEIAERIRKAIENAVVQTPDGEVKYTLSIGVSEFTKDAKSLSSAIETADKGLYEAKETGRNRVVVRRLA